MAFKKPVSGGMYNSNKRKHFNLINDLASTRSCIGVPSDPELWTCFSWHSWRAPQPGQNSEWKQDQVWPEASWWHPVKFNSKLNRIVSLQIKLTFKTTSKIFWLKHGWNFWKLRLPELASSCRTWTIWSVRFLRRPEIRNNFNSLK